MPKGTATVQATRMWLDEDGEIQTSFKGLTASLSAIRKPEQLPAAFVDLSIGKTIVVASSFVPTVKRKWEEGKSEED